MHNDAANPNRLSGAYDPSRGIANTSRATSSEADRFGLD
jgi:hypothetical protein